MVYLAYCIMRATDGHCVDRLAGVGGARLQLVESGELCAAVSEHESLGASPTVEDALVYSSVVDALFKQGTVIPLRYGNIVQEREEIIQLLENGRGRHLRLLGVLDGCVEMGIRIIPEEDACEAVPPAPESPAEEPFPSGRSYLQKRKAHYQVADSLPEGCQGIADRIGRRFEGMFRKTRSDLAHPQGGRLLSLYYLVPKEDVERFSSAFRTAQATEQTKLLLSGPWPPWSFTDFRQLL